MKNLLNLIIDAAKNDDMNRVIELAEKQQDKFCDNNCVWTDHHPDCKLAKQKQGEPVAWLCQKDNGHFDVLTDQTCKKCFPVYTHPQPKQEQGEPVGFVVDRYNGANTPASPPTPMVAWLNDNPKIGQIFYTTPQPKQDNTDLDAICQDLQEKTYTQAMRIAELEAKLAEADKQDGWVLREVLFSNGEPIAHREAEKQEQGEPVAFIAPNCELRKTAEAKDASEWGAKFEPLYTHPQPKREPPKAGDGRDLFYEAVRLLDNAIFAQSGDVVRHDLAAHKEALDFFNHVFTRLDLTPSQPKREWVGLTDDEITALKRNSERYISSQDFARAVETKLKEKNT